MDLTNEFRVALPVERAWAVLTDLERIAPCMPGAQLQEVEGEEHRGVVKIKVGPITAQYKGQARFLDRDEANHVAVLRAEGRETRGQGSANATITATLRPDDGGTAVSIVTDLTVTGRVAQFGRGVLADVSANLLGQFVECLEQTVLVGDAVAPDAVTTPPAADGAAVDQPASEEAQAPSSAPPAVVEAERSEVRKIDSPEPTPVNLVGAAGSPLAKRVGPILAIVALAWLLKKLFGRSK